MHNVGNISDAASYSKNATIESHAKLGNDVSLAVSNEAALVMSLRVSLSTLHKPGTLQSLDFFALAC